jgi:hypothetical protein
MARNAMELVREERSDRMAGGQQWKKKIKMTLLYLS